MKRLFGAIVAASALIGTASASVTPVEEYYATSAIGGGNDHSVWMPVFEDISVLPTYNNADGSDFDFTPYGLFTVYDDGSASLNGVITSQVGGSEYQFEVSLILDGRTGPGSMGPKKELPSGQYVENGGTVDTSTWRYWDLVSGSLTGLNTLTGLNLDLTIRPADNSMPLQLGEGANGKNTDLGLAMWFYLTKSSDCTSDFCGYFTKSYHGDFNLDLTPTPLPAGFLLFATGAAGIAAVRRRRKA